MLLKELRNRVLQANLELQHPTEDAGHPPCVVPEVRHLWDIAYAHSEYATARVQARHAIACFGTTHADYFRGAVPVTQAIGHNEIAPYWQKNTGYAMAHTFDGIDYAAVPRVLVANHGTFTWGRDATTAAESAVVLEMLAQTACLAIGIDRVRKRFRKRARQALPQEILYERL